MKLGTYGVASGFAAMAIVFHAFQSRGQFYPAMLYLATSKISLVLLLNMALVLLCALWKLLKVLFLGTLREAEIERLNEQSWRELMEILFAMTIFREEFSVTFVSMVTVLLFIKAFHWLAQKRVEYIETTPSVSRLSHFRIVSFMALLLLLDSVFLYNSASFLLKTKRPSVALFFAFEYVILATSTMAIFLKYVFYICDMFMEGHWENKAVWTFYLELVRDLLHLSLYLFFFLVIFIYYGLPLHLVRELYETFRNFKARVADFVRYRKITSNLNDRFPDATSEELGRSDATCIICREEMVAAKKLPCGHLFHVHCLRSWLERQQTCPTCRSPVLAPEGAVAIPGADGVPPPILPQQRQQMLQGQGNTAEPERLSRQFNSQVLGATEATNFYTHQQARLQAAVTAASQYGNSLVYPALHMGGPYWYPAYVYVPPQTYMTAILGPGMNAGIGEAVDLSRQGQRESDISNVAETSSLGSHHLSNCHSASTGANPDLAQRPPSHHWQFSSGFPYAIQLRNYPWIRPYDDRNSQDISGTSHLTVPPPATLEWQQLQLQQGIEVLQQQLQKVVELRNKVSMQQQPDAKNDSLSGDYTSTSSAVTEDSSSKGKGPASSD